MPAALGGLLAGVVARRIVARFTPIRRWGWGVEGASLCLWAVLAWRLAPAASLIVYLYGAAAGTVLAIVDWRSMRLPEAVTLPSYVITIILLVVEGGWELLQPALIGMAVLLAFQSIIFWLGNGESGFGDVTLCGWLGLLLGPLGPAALITGLLAGYVTAALYFGIMIARRKAGMHSRAPLGPFLLAGALIGVLLPV